MGKNDNDNDGPALSDEEWARFMEQAQADAGRAPREPSARARMVTARLRGESAEPPGWRTGPAWQEREGRGRGKRRLKAAGAIVFIAALALIAVRPELVIDKVTGKADRNDKARGPLPAETARPSAPPSAVDPDRPTLKEPFKGSPALQWADGAAGIEVPAAEAVGGMSKAQVADALEKAKQFLVAANLDPATLRGERPAAALALLDPKLEEQMDRLEESLTAPTKEHDPLHLFSRVKPAELKPVGDVVKVRGRMWVEPGKEAGQANVLADYTFVHPFVKAKPGAEQVERTVVRREITFSIADPGKWQATAGKLWLEKFNVDLANSACNVYDGFLHPVFDEDTPTGPAPSGTPVDPYDRSKTMDTGGQEGCGTVSRT
ncbi:hypothetical protein OHB36_04345 [Streptomyces sp. NBC_00320]|uniref:hypothetical protein n=1 Tax=unclassified Streptomyces TaxID=2593676 RepID=UPI0022577B7B|nr:hypothetical protein [Streptomyces sp. NBC_00320]MCX5146022.1 hypothetical protein [Streptomyces sp. NBC_00320]